MFTVIGAGIALFLAVVALLNPSWLSAEDITVALVGVGVLAAGILIDAFRSK